MRVLLLFALLTACTRPLTPAETQLLAPIHGTTLDTARMRLTRAPIVGAFPITYDARPRTTCRERIGPPEMGRITARTGGIALFQNLLLSGEAYRDDYAVASDAAPLDLAYAMFLVHEATHVWQWQNRARTGYHPIRAFTEQIAIDDPYLLDPDPTRPFLAHGFEQQASLVEEYLCCATLDPKGKRTGTLQGLLSQVMPVAAPEAFALSLIHI